MVIVFKFPHRRYENDDRNADIEYWQKKFKKIMQGIIDGHIVVYDANADSYNSVMPSLSSKLNENDTFGLGDYGQPEVDES